MSVEPSRGTELPAGAPAPTSADGVRMQILATEHWSLLATRSLDYTDSFSRASMFFSVLSGTVIALALIVQGGRFEGMFFTAAILLLPIVFFVGIATIARIGNLNSHDVVLVIGMNRIRNAYLTMHPELEQYFITGHNDDIQGVLKTLGINAPAPGQHFLSDLGHGMQTLPGMLAIIVSVVGGAWAALVFVALGANQSLAIGAGAVFFLLTIAANAFFARRAVMTFAKGQTTNFPSPAEKKQTP